MLVLLALGLPAFAFRAAQDIDQGSEPVRVRRYSVERQHALRHSAAWQEFLAGEGAGWQVRFDERTGTPYRAWGPGIDLGLSSDTTEDTAAAREQVGAALLAFLARNDGLLGIDPSELQLGRTGYAPATDTWYVHFDRIVLPSASSSSGGGTPGGELGGVQDSTTTEPGGTGAALGAPPIVWRGGVLARIKFGKLILLGVQTYPGADNVDIQPDITVDDAFRTAIAAGPVPEADHHFDGARLVVLPEDRGSGIGYRLCWEIRAHTGGAPASFDEQGSGWDGDPNDPPGMWVSFVDAHTGELVHFYNQVRFVRGSIEVLHDVRTVDGSTTTSPLRWARISTDTDTDHTGGDGSFDIPGDPPVTASLAGPYFTVINMAGDNAEFVIDEDGVDSIWTDTADEVQAQLDSYVYLHQVHDWAQVYAPDVPVASMHQNSKVNENDVCNAYWDGSLNFFKAGGGCNNTARVADVAYHEWGHSFHYYNLESGTFDDSISEGIADTVAFLQTGDSTIAPYFWTNGAGIREVSVDKVYPDDINGEPHNDGLIFAGAMWDLWAALEEHYNADEAYDILNTDFVNALKAGPDIPGAFDEFIAADDDDADLSNGTPHQCEIIDAFSQHGLGPGGSASLLELSHEPIENQSAAASAYPVQADVVNLAPSCVAFHVETSQVHYSIDDGQTWQTAELIPSDDSVSGSIPAQPDGSIVQYYLTATSDDGSEVQVPSGGPINPFTFFVGDLEPIYCEDFEADDGGYTHELLSGRDELGADDWMWGTPRGLGGDPDFAYSGDNVWGNDLGGGNYNGEYQNGKDNELLSPEIDVSGYDRVILQYRRWLNVEDGVYDHANVLVNGQVIWTNYASSRSVGNKHTQDQQWHLHTLDVPLDGTGQVQLGWEIQSDEGLTFGGWNIDDVCLYGVVPSADSAASDTAGSSAGEGDAMNSNTSLRAGACGGCASGGSNPSTWLGGVLAGLVALARRRRR